MQIALLGAALALGLASAPHCAAMCSATCVALTGGERRCAGGFHLGRLAGYMAGGALAASSVAALAAASAAAPVLRPLWMLMHLALFTLGLWWLATGRHPQRLARAGAVPIVFAGRAPALRRATLAGLGWVAWPCPALQAALMLAALASGPLGGAGVMAGFAIASAPALAIAPWLLGRWRLAGEAGARSAAPARIAAAGFRIAGGALAITSGWALTHGIRERFAAWCLG